MFVAEFFLTQTPADNVAAVYSDFLERFPTLEAIAEAREDELAEIIEPLGFYNMRTQALVQIASTHDRLPSEQQELMELPRVGRYVTNATLCFARGDQPPVLDRTSKGCIAVSSVISGLNRSLASSSSLSVCYLMNLVRTISLYWILVRSFAKQNHSVASVSPTSTVSTLKR